MKIENYLIKLKIGFYSFTMFQEFKTWAHIVAQLCEHPPALLVSHIGTSLSLSCST